MSRWTQYLERYERRRNAFLLLTLSGAIRPAEVEAPCFAEGWLMDWEEEQPRP